MPFYKYIIETKRTKNKVSCDSPENEAEFDEGYFANQRMTNIIRHISQLAKIAEDIFGTIEIECRNVYERTAKLNLKMQNCKETVDTLNAKTVKVPIGSLSDCQKAYLHFNSCDAEKIPKVSIFASFPRPSAVDKLRELAQGPSPPAVIPYGMVASEVDGFSGTISSSKSQTPSTHIYCKPGKVNYDSKSRASLESGDSNGQDKDLTPKVKVPSSVVPIDVSGQPFSRMASFRRSLIHVDFLMRRKKKKDKRRNTVTEGDVKELKDALHKMVADESQLTLPNSICAYQQIITESKNGYNAKLNDNQQNEKNSVEENNNAANVNSLKENICSNSVENKIIYQERSKNVLNSEGLKKEVKLNETENSSRHLPSSKRKVKSHIPISTVSAAMNVAVEMRQCNGIRKELPVLNCVSNSDNNSSDSDNKLQEDKRNSNSSCNEDGSQDESWTSYKKRLQDKCRTLTNRNSFNKHCSLKKEVEVSSSASSETTDPQDNAVSEAISTDSDTFFISSDESDEDTSEVAGQHENYGSTTSIDTVSDGSLNSLLSETGTEMTSSTGTLTSIGHERLLASPPPPPPMILSATITDRDIVGKVSDLASTENITDVKCKRFTKPENIHQKQTKIPENIHQKQTKKPEIIPIKQVKPSKSKKSDIFDLQRNISENSKNILTSLVALKTHSKDKNKSKCKEVEKKKLNKNLHQPAFDMYGNNSPKTKQIPAFIKENISPVIKNEEKNYLKSFSANDKSRNSTQLSDNEDKTKSKSDCTPQRNIMCHDDQSTSDMTKTKGIQTVENIPSKYKHQVTVKPVQRCTDAENKNIHHKSSVAAENQQNVRCGSMPRSSCTSNETQIYAPRYQRPHPPTTLLQQDRSKYAARVVLDFDGKVIYTTNSLDRKHCIPGHTVNMYSPTQNKIQDPHFKDRQVNYDNSYYPCQGNHMQQNYQALPASSYNSNAIYSQGNNASMYSSPHVQVNYNAKENRSKNEHYMRNSSCSLKQSHALSHILSPQTCMSENMQTFVPKRTDTRPFSYAGNSPDAYLNSPLNTLIPDPNISGLPVQETLLTRHNVNLHSKQMEKMNTSAPEGTFNRLSDSFCVSPSSKTNNMDILSKSPQSTMSTEDLFAVIHDCKKRMNIKTDSDISLASSSRSSSPSYLRPSSSRGTLAETGFLSPRNPTHLEISGDRRSWADFRPVKDSICHERKSLASDRLGPTKPTSMHDFKMLLLQARTSSQISGPRKSAVEMLKVPLNQNKNDVSSPPPLNSSPKNYVSISAQNSPTVELNLYNGHSTVPFKRGNRVRTSLQSRYIMYPPIFEDCSEDSENCGDINSDKFATNVTGIGGSNNSDRKHNSNNRSIQSDQEYSCDSELNSQQD